MGRAVGCLAIVAIVAVIAVFWGVSQYNGLVKSQEAVSAAWSQVENVYQRRMDLIPNLVATVKGVANFEKETYIAVAEARSKAGQKRFRKTFSMTRKPSGSLSRVSRN